jgi:hypothetical protein
MKVCAYLKLSVCSCYSVTLCVDQLEHPAKMMFKGILSFLQNIGLARAQWFVGLQLALAVMVALTLTNSY